MRVLPSSIYEKAPPINYGEQNIGPAFGATFFVPWRWYLSAQIIEAIKVCYPVTFYSVPQAFREGSAPAELHIPELWLETGSRAYIDDGKVEISSAESLVGSLESIIQE